MTELLAVPSDHKGSITRGVVCDKPESVRVPLRILEWEE